MNKLFSLVALAACGLLCQCAGMRGHPNHAMVRSERAGSSQYDLQAVIKELDGREVTPGESRSGILLRPGPHMILASARREVGEEKGGRYLGSFGRKVGAFFDNLSSRRHDREIDFDARAGRDYILRARDGDPVRLWLDEE